MTPLEIFINTGEIEISRHPLSNLRRVARLDLQGWFPERKQITMDFTVKYIDEEGNPFNKISISPYQIQLIAGSDVKVNPQTFQVINPPVGNRPEEIIDEQLNVSNQAEIDAWDSANTAYSNAKTEYEVIRDQLNDDVNAYQKMYDMTIFRASSNGGSKFDK